MNRQKEAEHLRVVFLELSKITDRDGNEVDGVVVTTVPKNLDTPDDWEGPLNEIITMHTNKMLEDKVENPLDMKFDKPSRIAFHLNVPGWRFQEEEAGFQLKDGPQIQNDTFRDKRLFPAVGRPDRTTAVLHNDLYRGNAVSGANNRWKKTYPYELLLEIPIAHVDKIEIGTFPLPVVFDPDIENEGDG